MNLRLAGRLVTLYVGLVLFGVSMAMLVQAHLGVIPWDVLHQGISRHTGWSLGTTVIVIGFLVLLLWIPLRERPGFGTLSNVVVIGLALDEAVRLLPTPSGPAARIALVAGGITLNAFATLLYLKARMGAGPRDGLLTALLRITRLPAGVLKVAIEGGVVAIGWLLGGTVGAGTIAFVLCVGPMIQLLGLAFPALALTRPAARPGTDTAQPGTTAKAGTGSKAGTGVKAGITAKAGAGVVKPGTDVAKPRTGAAKPEAAAALGGRAALESFPAAASAGPAMAVGCSE